MSDLKDLEFPRHLHKPGELSCIVADVVAASQAIAEGWSVDPQVRMLPAGASVPVPVVAPEPDAPTPIPESETPDPPDTADDAPRKKSRKT